MAGRQTCGDPHVDCLWQQKRDRKVQEHQDQVRNCVLEVGELVVQDRQMRRAGREYELLDAEKKRSRQNHLIICIRSVSRTPVLRSAKMISMLIKRVR